MFSSNIRDCDSISFDLHNSTHLYALVYTVKAILKTNGHAEVKLPSMLLNHEYSITIRHRNSIETWSKNPVLFNSDDIIFDFTR